MYKLLIISILLTACGEIPATFSEAPVQPEHWEPVPTPTDIPAPVPDCKYQYAKKYKVHIYVCKPKRGGKHEAR
jgi:hypothetical protein